MGEFLVNLFVRTEDQGAVVEAIKPILQPAYQRANSREAAIEEEAIALYVAPPIRGWVGLFDLLMEKQDEALCEWTARQLSRTLSSVAICFLLHDGDFIRYWLAQRGRLMDRYHSWPDYFGPIATAETKRLQGRPRVLADLCGMPLAALDLARTLREPGEFAFDLLDDLDTILQIPNLLLGHNTVEEDAEQGYIEGWEGFRRISLRELLGA